METLIREKRYTYADIKDKKRSNAWILIKIAMILYSRETLSIKQFALGLLSYAYKFKVLTDKQVQALYNVYIEDTILLENIDLDIKYLNTISIYDTWYSLNALQQSLPVLINIVTTQEEEQRGTEVESEEKFTKDPHEQKLMRILYNEGKLFSTPNRNIALKIMKDYHLIERFTRHMQHVLETIVPNGNDIKYKPLPKRKQLLEGYLNVYDNL